MTRSGVLIHMPVFSRIGNARRTENGVGARAEVDFGEFRGFCARGHMRSQGTGARAWLANTALWPGEAARALCEGRGHGALLLSISILQKRVCVHWQCQKRTCFVIPIFLALLPNMSSESSDSPPSEPEGAGSVVSWAS